MRFVKMHGLGNDYVFVDGRLTNVDDPAGVSRLVSDRHRGIGSDGLILIDPPEDPTNHARMRMFNADGSRGEMCGNGIRCIAKFLVDRGITEDDALRIETDGGLRRLGWSRGADGRVDSVDVDMGPPTLVVDRIPADLPGLESGATAIERAFDPAATNDRVEAIAAAHAGDVAAWELPGAGGGGFVLMLARDDAAATRIRNRVDRHPANELVRRFPLEIDREGLRVTVL